MAVVRLDLRPDPDAEPFEQLVVLDGLAVRLAFRWNDRAQRWVMSIAADDGTMLSGSIAVCNNWDLLAPHRHDPRVPPGVLLAWAQTDPNRDAGKDELGGRVGLYYSEAA